MTYLIFPTGLCVYLENRQIQRVFYIEESRSIDDVAIRCFLQEASHYCDYAVLTSLDPQQVLGCFAAWYQQNLPLQEKELLEVAERMTQNLSRYFQEVDDLISLIGSSKVTGKDDGCGKN